METAIESIRRFPKRALRHLFINIKSIDEACKDVTKHYLVPQQIVSTPAAASMDFYPLARALKGADYDFPGGYCAQLDTVIYDTVAGTIKTPARTILADSINTARLPDKFSIRETLFSPVEKIENDELYSLFRSTNNSYYHVIVDNLSRLYLLSKVERGPIKILFPGKPTAVEQFFIDKLLPDNAQLEFVEPGKSYLVKRLLFPSFMTRHCSGYLPTEYLDYFKARVLPKRPRKKTNRILISRGPNLRNPHKQRRRLLNEASLARALEPYGFQLYRLEDLSIEEQVNLFYDAEFVIGAHGAGLSNIIFSENIGVLELYPSHQILPYYYYLAQSLGHRYTYLCGSKKSIHANFEISPSTVLDALQPLLSTAESDRSVVGAASSINA